MSELTDPSSCADGWMSVGLEGWGRARLQRDTLSVWCERMRFLEISACDASRFLCCRSHRQGGRDGGRGRGEWMEVVLSMLVVERLCPVSQTVSGSEGETTI